MLEYSGPAVVGQLGSSGDTLPQLLVCFYVVILTCGVGVIRGVGADNLDLSMLGFVPWFLLLWVFDKHDGLFS